MVEELENSNLNVNLKVSTQLTLYGTTNLYHSDFKFYYTLIAIFFIAFLIFFSNHGLDMLYQIYMVYYYLVMSMREHILKVLSIIYSVH